MESLHTFPDKSGKVPEKSDRWFRQTVEHQFNPTIAIALTFSHKLNIIFMKQIKITSIFILLLFLIACRKEKSLDNILPKPDKIKYFDFVPDTNVHSVRTSSPLSYVIPGDSSASMKIDLNGDSKTDIEFVATHSTDYINPHYTAYYFGVWINSNNDSLLISSKNTKYGDRPVFYDSLITVQKDSLWKTHVLLSISSPSAGVYFDFKASFIGYKIGNKYGWIKISPYTGTSGGANGVVIENFAINLTENNLIKTGQRY